MVIPLSTGGGPLIGVLTFDTLKAERVWPEELVQRLTLVAQVFSNALAGKRSEQVLRESEARLSLAADSAGSGIWERRSAMLKHIQAAEWQTIISSAKAKMEEKRR